MIVTVVGEDEFSKETRIERFLQEALGDRRDDPMAKQILYATDTNVVSVADSVITACDSVSMFAPEQVVVVRKGEAIKADDVRSLVSWLNHKPQCKLLFEFSKLDGRGEFYKALKAAGELEKYDAPQQYKMADWISAAIPSHFKKAIERDACAYLADALGNNTKLVCEEVEKVLLFVPDCPKITYALVKDLVVPRREMPAYEINNPFGLRDVNAYTKKLNELLNNCDKVSVQAIVLSLYNYAVDLLKFSTLLSKGKSPKEATAILGKNEYVFLNVGRAADCAKRWNRVHLCHVIKRLADLNFEVNSGKCESKVAQELALAALVFH